jgi:hypothetical protein
VYMVFKMPSFRCRNRDMILCRSWSKVKGQGSCSSGNFVLCCSAADD